MIKLWKKKWKEQNEHNSHETPGGSGSSGPSLRSSEPAPPADFQPVVPSARPVTKRSQTQAFSDPTPAPPAKKAKTDPLSTPYAPNSMVEPDGASCSPNEVVLVYDPVPEGPETELFLRVVSMEPSETIFRRQLKDARRVRADVGTCAADLVWRRALKDMAVDPLPYSEDEDDDGPLEILNKAKVKIRDLVKNWTFTMPNLEPNSQGFNVTPKFLRLPYGEDFRGIVFVKRRAVAFALSDLIPMLGDHIGFIRAHTFTGQRSLLLDDKPQTSRYPKSTIVIRFDLFEGDVSRAFAQSLTAGNAGHLGNDGHRHNLLSTTVLSNSEMARWANILRCCPTSAIPPRPLIAPRCSEQSDSEEEEAPESSIEDPVTGGRIYLRDATMVVYRLASTVNPSPFPSPLFDFQSRSSMTTPSPVYTCTVLIPGTPAHNTTGPPCSSMSHARRAACYNFCVKLAETGFLESKLFPLSTSTGAATVLFPLIITVPHPNQPPHAPIVLLTRQSLPHFPIFKLFYSSTPTPIHTYRGTPLVIDHEKLGILHMYTLRLCRAVANKPFTCPLEDMPTGRWDLSDVAAHIPWDVITLGAQSWSVPLKYGQSEDITSDIEDAVIQDRSTELTRRYDVLRVRPDLSPLSPSRGLREAEYSSLLDYCKNIRKNFEGLKDEKQAIIEVSSIMCALSRLDPAARPPPPVGPPPPRYLIPELCFKFTIPASTFRTALLLPSISRRLDGFLLAKELNARLFDHQISDSLLDMAITTPSTRMEYDYERLEWLGDSFLKYLTSIYVFVNEPSNKEGVLHTARQHLVSNNTLFHSSHRAGLPSYLQSKPFSIKSWQPPNFRTSPEQASAAAESNRHRKDAEQRLGDKTALMAAKAMHIPLPNLLIPPPIISAKMKPGALQAVEKMTRQSFKHPHLLAQALDTSVYPMNGLNLSATAILEFLVIRHIFERYQNMTPGGLTLLKGAMVSNSALAAVCISSGLHNHFLQATRLTGAVTDYMERLQVKQAEEYELARVEKRPPGQYWQEIEPPKVSRYGKPTV
ncbi:hypothetical protein C8R46DRAFT_1073070 [Mycena filopes]|nr:hypothetical protein C8R46DRAFT_1073070 [Mycena filopes]